MKKSLALLVIITLILSSCGAKPAETKIEKNLKEVNVLNSKKSPITEEIKLIGRVFGDKETVISSQISGIINKINVKPGDNIKKDDILATIDTNSQVGIGFDNANIAFNNSSSIYNYTTESIQKDIELAKLQLETAKTNKENTYDLTQKQIDIAKRQLDNIKDTKNNTETSNKENIKNAELALELAKKGLDTAKLNLDNFTKNKSETLNGLASKKTSILRNIVSSIQSSYININSALNSSDLLIGVTDKNRNYNDSFESYLGAKSSFQKSIVEGQIKDLIEMYDKNIGSIKSLNDTLEGEIKNNLVTLDSDNQTYSSALSDTLDYLTKLKKSLSDITDILNNSITSVSFPQSSLDGYKSTISANQTAILQSESTLISLKNSLEDLKSSISSTKTSLDTQENTLSNAIDLSNTQVDSAKQALSLLTANIGLNSSNVDGNVKLTDDQLQNAITSAKNSRDQVDNAVKIAESQLNSSIAKLNSQLIQTKASLDSSKGQKDLAGIQVNNSIIKAPFDSTIISKSIELGTLVGQSTPLFTIASTDKLKIKLDITGENASYIKEGDSVKLEFTNGKIGTGTITLASKNANPQTNLFPIEISFDGASSNSKLGDFVTIYIDKKLGDKTGIMLPFESILNPSDGLYTIFVLSGSIVNSREVKLGLKNSSQVEITSGLKEGEKVVITKVTDLENGEEVKVIK